MTELASGLFLVHDPGKVRLPGPVRSLPLTSGATQRQALNTRDHNKITASLRHHNWRELLGQLVPAESVDEFLQLAPATGMVVLGLVPGSGGRTV